jgi:Txe/YoeB family toxin of Txe-Axe toxin-antitoxin module
MPVSLPVQGAPMQQFAPVAPVVSSTVTPAVAEDIDLIEKAWVEKAKEIVKATHGDPYSQNKELNKVKADYIKKRYDKDVKVVE